MWKSSILLALFAAVHGAPQRPFDRYNGPGEHFRDIYFYGSPFETESVSVGRIIDSKGGSTRDRFVIIHTPTYRLDTPEVPVTSGHQQRTRIFVLSKKPEGGGLIDIGKALPTPSKPEVVFLKYGQDQTIYKGAGTPPGAVLHPF